MHEARGGLQRRISANERLDLRHIAEKQEFALGVARQRQLGTGYNHGRAMVSPHRV
jgi:hypothetical protein